MTIIDSAVETMKQADAEIRRLRAENDRLHLACDRICKVAADLERGEISRTLAASDLRRILAATEE